MDLMLVDDQINTLTTCKDVTEGSKDYCSSTTGSICIGLFDSDHEVTCRGQFGISEPSKEDTVHCKIFSRLR
jgi:hypothetical protein